MPRNAKRASPAGKARLRRFWRLKPLPFRGGVNSLTLERKPTETRVELRDLTRSVEHTPMTAGPCRVRGGSISLDRKDCAGGKSWPVRVGLGSCRKTKKKNTTEK